MLDHIGKEGYGEREDEQMEAVGETADGDTDRHDSACRGTAGRLFGRDFYAEDGQAADTPVASVTFGPLSYCRGKLESGSSSVELMNLCRALYYYWEAAVIPPT